MTNAAEKLLEAALELPAEEREQLGRRLLESAVADEGADGIDLEALDAAIEQSYEDEAAGRVRDVFDAFPRVRPER